MAETIGDVFYEAREYLKSLTKSFAPAIAQLNQKERSFKILDVLSIGDIYTEADIDKLKYFYSKLGFEVVTDDSKKKGRIEKNFVMPK